MKKESKTPNLGFSLGILAVGLGIGFVFGNKGQDEFSASGNPVVSQSVQTRTMTDRNRAETREATKGVDEIFSQSGQSSRVQGLIELYENLGADEFADQAEKLQNLSRSDRMIATYLLFSKWGEVDPMAALGFSSKMGFIGQFAKPTILQSWAGTDPQGAAKYYEDNASDFERRGWRGRGRGGNPASGIAREWAKSNPEAAFAWTTTLEGRSREQAERSFFSQLAQADPADAARKLSELGDLQNKGAAVNEIARQWGQLDAAEAEAWARTLTGDEQSSALASIVQGLASSDVSAASSKALNLPVGESRERAIGIVATQMSREDPVEAVSYLMTNGVENTQRDAMREPMQNWASQDSTAAKSFLGTLESGGVRDSAIMAYVDGSRNVDPRQTVEMALSVGDERLRERATRRAAESWLRVDSEAAKQFISETDVISDRRKEWLLRD